MMSVASCLPSSTPSQSQNSKTFSEWIPNAGRPVKPAREGDEVLADRCLVSAGRVEQPRTGAAGVGQRLLGGERLGGDHEERRLGIDLREHLVQLRRVEVRNEVGAQIRQPIPRQRPGHHQRTQIGAADSDVDDVTDRHARVSGPAPGAHLLGEPPHAFEPRFVPAASRRSRW